MPSCDPLLLILYKLVPTSLYKAIAARIASLRPRIVIDIGGGAGLLARALRAQGFLSDYVLIEPDECLARRAPGTTTHIVMSVAENLPLRRISDSVAVFHDSLHHIPDPYTGLREAAATASCIIVSDYDASSWLGKILTLAEKLIGYPAKFLTLKELTRQLRQQGLGIKYVDEKKSGSYIVAACEPKRG